MATLDKQLYLIVWQEHDQEPDWLHVVAKNLTEARAKKYIAKYLEFIDENVDPSYEYFWYTDVPTAEGVGTKDNYNIIVAKQ